MAPSCGPLYGDSVCNCAHAGKDFMYCNEENGWCGQSAEHQKRSSGKYDCGGAARQPSPPRPPPGVKPYVWGVPYCGPLFEGGVCDCRAAGKPFLFCNEKNGWCGMSQAHRDLSSGQFDCGRAPAQLPEAAAPESGGGDRKLPFQDLPPPPPLTLEEQLPSTVPPEIQQQLQRFCSTPCRATTCGALSQSLTCAEFGAISCDCRGCCLPSRAQMTQPGDTTAIGPPIMKQPGDQTVTAPAIVPRAVIGGAIGAVAALAVGGLFLFLRRQRST